MDIGSGILIFYVDFFWFFDIVRFMKSRDMVQVHIFLHVNY